MNVRNATFTLGLIAAFTAANPFFAQNATPKLVTPIAASAATAVPSLVPYSGAAVPVEGRVPTGDRGVTFQIFKEETGGEPLWIESQTVALDSIGHYSVQLGAASPNGLPTDLFATGEARWLEVQIAGQPVQARILLASVPYALKAADATTLGGLPASAYALAGTRTASSAISPAIHPDIVSNVTTTGGTSGYVPVFNGASTVIDSPVFASGANVGIGTTTPTAALDVVGTTSLNGDVAFNGSSTYKGELTFEPTNTANASAGHDSQALKFYASAYDSANMTAVNPRFYWQAEPQGNNTAAPTGTLNLLASRGTNSASETGFFFNPNGTINFAPGQTFPDTSATFPANSTDSAYFGGAGNSTSTGSDDTASGFHALSSNKTGSLDTALGFSAGPDPGSTGLTNATAIGANATVSQSNSLVLGKTTAGSPGTSHVNVGIGTAKPISAMEIAVSSNGAIGPALTLTNPGGNPSCCTNAADAIDFNTQPISTVGTYNPNARIEVVDDGAKTGDMNFLSNIYPGSGNGVSNNGLQTNMTIWGNGNGVSIGTNQEGAQLEVVSAEGEGIDVFGGQQADGSMTQGVLALRVGGGFSSGTDAGGLGAWILGGDSESTGTSGEGLLVWPGEPSSGATGLAADFEGDVFVDGTLSANLKDFKIDHPLDPANKYLVHASVESSEMMNIYSGNVTTDDLGLATVTLPDWFQAENGDFRYQLTVIGGRFAQAIVSKEIANNQFTISTNATNVKVSWQVTAVRQDAYAKAHPMVVEEAKPAKERGFYQHPELYGQPREKQTQSGIYPAMVAQMKAEKAKMKQGLLSTGKKATPQSTAATNADNRNSAHPAAPAIQPPASGAQLKPISQVESK